MGIKHEAPLNPAYTGPRDDVLRLVPVNARRVLDVGCSVGHLGSLIKSRQDAHVVGIEFDSGMAAIAAQRLDSVSSVDLDHAGSLDTLSGRTFDCIVLADILEHLRDPWGLLRAVCKQLDGGGAVVISLPNVGHYSTMASLLFRARWPYRSRGIHDRTHLRFFAFANLGPLLEGADLEIVQLVRSYRLVERPHRLNRFSHLFALPGLRNLLTFQFLIVARQIDVVDRSPASGTAPVAVYVDPIS